MQFLILLASALTALNVVLASPHGLKNMARHHAMAARAPVPVLEDRPITLKRRQSRKCTPPQSSPQAPPANIIPTSSAAPSTSQQQAPPATTPAAPAPAAPAPAPPSPSPSPAPAPAAPASGSGAAPGGYMAGTNSGDGTFYDAGLGSCGITNTDNDLIVAVAHANWDNYPGWTDSNPNHNPICGKQIIASYEGRSVTVTVTDKCPGCDKPGSLDFSKAAFGILTNNGFGKGRIPITWQWA